MNNFNFYSFIDDFDDFLECSEGIENIEFGEPPTQFSHWCSGSDTENPAWHCLDCCYIRKYHVRNYYVLIRDTNISLHSTNDCLSFYSSAKLNFVCLLFHFKIKDGKKSVYISINYIRPINNVFEESIRDTYFNEQSIRNILDGLVKEPKVYQ
jgi:hypothetical protein